MMRATDKTTEAEVSGKPWLSSMAKSGPIWTTLRKHKLRRRQGKPLAKHWKHLCFKASDFDNANIIFMIVTDANNLTIGIVL